MASHRYRVLKELPWIEEGRPVPFGWEGGRAVVYQPGDTVEINDRELDGVYRRIEAIDDGGRSVLEAARAKGNQPARRIAVADLHPRMVEWMSRTQDERLRNQGRLAELCLRMIDRGDDPSREDLAAALEAPDRRHRSCWPTWQGPYEGSGASPVRRIHREPRSKTSTFRRATGPQYGSSRSISPATGRSVPPSREGLLRK